MVRLTDEEKEIIRIFPIREELDPFKLQLKPSRYISEH
jgi:hypothetical protein